MAGALGALGAAVLASVWRAETRFVSGCEVTNYGECISLRFPALLVGPLIITALIWLAVWVAGVDRALPAALLGAFLTADAALLHQGLQPRWTPPPEWLAATLGAAGFAAGVLLALRRVPLVVQVGAAALLLAVPYGIFPPLRQASLRADREAAFAQLGLPLLVARVDGYRVDTARADRADRRLSVSMSRGEFWFTIVVVVLPAGFAPPAHCGPTTDDLDGDRPADPATTPPCRLLAADHWVRTEREDPVHLIRRDDALVYVDPGIDVPASDLDAAVAHLTELTPQRLAELAVR